MSDAAYARGSDPWTSWAAARSLPPDLRPRQVAVLAVFARHGEMSLSQLLVAYEQDRQRGLLPPQSPSGIRTRASELGEMGRLIAVGLRVNENSRHEQVLAVAVPPYEPRPKKPTKAAPPEPPTEPGRLFPLPEPTERHGN